MKLRLFVAVIVLSALSSCSRQGTIDMEKTKKDTLLIPPCV